MNEERLNRMADQEAGFLQYYGYREHRKIEEFNDVKFYERMISIGYTKRVIPLPARCAGCYITSNKNVLDSTVEELREINEPRNHDKNIYTALEYILATEHHTSEKLISIIKKFS